MLRNARAHQVRLPVHRPAGCVPIFDRMTERGYLLYGADVRAACTLVTSGEEQLLQTRKSEDRADLHEGGRSLLYGILYLEGNPKQHWCNVMFVMFGGCATSSVATVRCSPAQCFLSDAAQ